VVVADIIHRNPAETGVVNFHWLILSSAISMSRVSTENTEYTEEIKPKNKEPQIFVPIKM
jgi:hypothetical protein